MLLWYTNDYSSEGKVNEGQIDQDGTEHSATQPKGILVLKLVNL